MSDANAPILQAIQAGFASTERQLTDLTTTISRLESKIVNVETRLVNVESELSEVKARLNKVEHRMHTVDSRLNGVDLRLIDMSDDIRGLQTQQNRVNEFLFDRPQS
jgi:septal ring factor EnvC (AmiA/AmiB activator)